MGPSGVAAPAACLSLPHPQRARRSAVPLSDHEQKLLAQMEQALYAEDPKFATTLTGRQRGVGSVSRALVAVASVAVGLTLVIVGISIDQLWVSVIGFVVMFGGVVFAVAAPASR